MVFSSSHVRMWKLDHKEGWALKNWSFQTVVWEKTFESPLHSKEIKPVNLMEISPEYSLEGLMLSWNSNTLAIWCKELTHLRPWCWERLKVGAEGDDRDGWMASATQWTWVWANSGDRESWYAAVHGVAKRHSLATEQQQHSFLWWLRQSKIPPTVYWVFLFSTDLFIDMFYFLHNQALLSTCRSTSLWPLSSEGFMIIHKCIWTFSAYSVPCTIDSKIIF